VSISTVSRVVNAPQMVREETRTKVMDAVARLGFVPKAEASLRARRNVGSIGVLLPFFTSPSFVQRMRGVAAALAGTEYELIVYTVESAERLHGYLDSLPLRRRLDGLILMSLPLEARSAQHILTHGLETVLIEVGFASFCRSRTPGPDHSTAAESDRAPERVNGGESVASPPHEQYPSRVTPGFVPRRPARTAACTAARTAACTALTAVFAALLAASCSSTQKPMNAQAPEIPAADLVLDGVSQVAPVAQLTGKDSINRTDRYGVYGCDLGSMFKDDGRTYFLFGDTFGLRSPSQTGAGGENWRSNTMAWSTTQDPANGITFDGWITDASGTAKELLSSRKRDNDEVTVIPTNGVAANGALYIFFMSVRHWGAPGYWDCNYSGIARSTDSGQTWTKLARPRWPGDSNFIQVAIWKQDHNLLIWGIPSGRHGGAALMEVPENQVESPGSYRYFAGTVDGSPKWSADMRDAAVTVDAPVGELSVAWNAYLGRWIMTCLNESSHNLEIREGENPWGPWGPARMLVSARRYPALYGPFMCPGFTAEGGKVIYFTMSQFGAYNVFLMRATLDRVSK
jgi:hypothetical protein